MDVLSVRNAQRMMSAVDGALRKIDAKIDLGATMNRMEHTIDNLSSVGGSTVSRGRIEDADMAEESVNLSKTSASTSCHCVCSGEPIDAIGFSA